MSSFRKQPSRPKLSATTSASSDPPTPSVSTVHAAGYSSLSKATGKRVSSRSSSLAASRDSTSHVSGSSTPTAPRSPPPKTRNGSRKASSGSIDKIPVTGSLRWFSRKGTWPRAAGKSAAVTEVAQESASGESLNTPPAESESKPGEQKPSNSSTTLLPMPSESAPPAPSGPAAPTVEVPVVAREAPAAPKPEPQPVAEVKEDAKDAKGAKDTKEPPKPEPAPAQPAGSWFGWWYGTPAAPNPQPAEAEPTKEPAEEPSPKVPSVETTTQAKPDNPPSKEPIKAPAKELAKEPAAEPPVSIPVEAPAESPRTDAPPPPPARPRSWFGIWSYAEPTNPINDAPEGAGATASANTAPVEQPAPVVPQPEPEPAQPEPSTPAEPPRERRLSLDSVSIAGKTYGWVFWSRDRRGTESSTVNGTEGEVAVTDGTEDGKVQKAKVKEVVAPSNASVTDLKPVPSVAALREESRKSGSRPSSPKPTPAKTAEMGASTTAMAPAAPPRTSGSDSSSAKKKLQKILPQNHLLPDFTSCYRPLQEPSLMQKLWIKKPPQPSKTHLHLARHPPRIRKAVAIGVHGFFPMKLVRTVLGEPTGTSIRFANSAANAIKRWAEKNGVEVEVEKIALEGEGKVGDRVEMLWRLLANWMDHVRSADFVMMAAHSQGVVVGVQLLARLIEEGCVDRARIGFLAMAGINLGPFAHLPTTLLTGSAKELFEFQKQDSAVSQKYIQSLRTVLGQNVRVCYVGSIDDQLVSIESSTMANISHPYIFRAVFVDGRVHAPDFLSHLVGFAMKLRNIGISDHGLIRELSAPLAGSLYGGEGHSTIYNDGAVYDLGVRHALETTDCEDVPLKVDPFELPTTTNPYFLPWSVRGLLEEPYVRTQLAGECMQLLQQFENWRPTSKVLKDVKFRLEGIRSKL